MKSKHFFRAVAIVLTVAMLVCALPLTAFASVANWSETNVTYSGATFGTNGYYNVISKKDYVLVPGAATETEMVLNNSTGTRRQVMHIIELDPSNPDVSVLPGYSNIDKLYDDPSDASLYKASGVTAIADYYDTTLGYQVVAAMNTDLDYTDNAPRVLVYNGKILSGYAGAGAPSSVLYVWNNEGEISCEVTDYKQAEMEAGVASGNLLHAISVSFGMTVRDGELVNKSENHNGGSDDAARSMVGVKADGTLVLVMNDGRGSNNSKGFCSYELGESMLALGCQWAANCDGGGSSSIVTRRAGEEDLVCRCVPCDGAERPTKSAVVIVSNVAPTGILDKVNVEADYDIFAPFTTYTFGTTALDTHGYAMDLPATATWALSDDTFGTIANGTFVSNGKTGDVTVQVTLAGEVIGEKTITVANPTTLGFTTDSTTLPYGKSTTLAFTSLIGEARVYLDGNSFNFALNNAGGTLNGLAFTAGNDESVAQTVITATYKPTSTVLTFTVNFGKGSEILWDFEDGIDGWWGYDETVDYLYSQGYIKEKSYKALNDYYNGTGSDNFSECVKTTTFAATAENGYVHNGNGALGVKLDFTQVTFNDWCYGVLFTANGGVLRDVANGKKAITLGMWIRLPEDDVQAAGKWCNQLTVWKGTDKDHLSGGQIHFQYKNAAGTLTNIASINPSDIPENRWLYVTATLPSDNYVQLADKDSNLYRSPSFSRSYIKPNVASELTFYMDDITLDYSSAVDDRVPPTISNPQYSTADTNMTFTGGVTIAEVSAAYTATISDSGSGIDASTAQIYIDGNKVTTQVAGNTMFCDNVSLGVGTHKVKFEIADNLGNYTTLTRTIVSESTDHYMKYRTRLELSGHNDSDEIPMSGSVYYIDVTSSYADNFGTAVFTLELNTANTWVLDAIQAADGYDVIYTYGSDTPNKVTFTVTSPKANSSTKVILTIPVRVYNPELMATSEATPQAISGRSFTAALDVKMTSCMYAGSYGNYSEFSIAEFAGNRTVTRHEHTAQAVADQAAALGVAGYTGRTYCDECQSIVDFGTIIPALVHTHTYELVNGRFVCSDETCGDILELGTGLVEVAGKMYYAIAGNLMTGWQQVEDDFYYFGDDFAGVDGAFTTPDAITFEFDNGRAVHGVWVKMRQGMRYWYGPGYYKKLTASATHDAAPYTVDGVTYFFDRQGYMKTGIIPFQDTTLQLLVYYDCGTDGVAKLLTGVYGNFFYENGIKQNNYKLVKASNGDIYFISDGHRIARNQTVYIGEQFLNGVTYADGTPLTADYYVFDADGKMTVKNGPVSGYFYINNEKQHNYKLVEYNGDFFFIDAGHRLATNTTLYIGAQFINGLTFADGTPIKEGYYSFDAEGKMIIKNGVVGNYLYINGERQTNYKLVKYDGKYYFINDGHMVTKSQTVYLKETFVSGKTFEDGTPIPAGYYAFDENGAMIIKNGVIGNFLYINNEKQKNYKLVKYDGNYYFINDGHMIAKNTTVYLGSQFVNGFTYEDGTPLAVGYYNFDNEGKMIIKNGPVGGYFYKNNEKQNNYKLVEFDGAYYFIGDGHRIATNTTLYLGANFVNGYTYADGTPMTEGYYEFDSEGKMVGLNGPIGGVFYRNNHVVRAYVLVEYEGNFYFIDSGNRIATNTKIYLGAQFVAGKTYADGSMVEVGYHSFDAEGKMIVD